MGQPVLQYEPMSIDDFVAWEAGQPERWEFVDGDVRAMTGATSRHNTAAMNIAFALRHHLRGSPCRIFISDVMLQTAHAACYPDVMVTCAPTDHESPRVKREPLLIVEVLSRSTARYDQTDKLRAYSALSSLREYVLIDPDRCRCVVHRRDDGWNAELLGTDEPLTLASVDLTIAAATLWEDLG